MANACPTKPHIKKVSEKNKISEGESKLIIKTAIESGKSEEEILKDFFKTSEILYVSKGAKLKAILSKHIIESLEFDSEKQAVAKAKEILIDNGISSDFFQIYKTNSDKYKVVVANIKEGDPKNNVRRQKSQPKNSSLAFAERIVEQIRKDSKRVTLDPNFEENHTYYIDGRKVDSSVSQIVHSDDDAISENETQEELETRLSDKEAYKPISTGIGNSVDAFVRDYFLGNTKKYYPNLSSEDIEILNVEMQKLVELFDNKYGKGKYKVLTEDIHLFSNYTDNSTGTPTIKTMVGTIDMLVYDDKGNFHLYDMKTARSNITGDKYINYSKQLMYYKTMLETQYPALKGKIDTPQILYFDVFYPAPITSITPNGINYVTTKEGEVMYIDNNGSAKHIYEHQAWKHPKLNPQVFLNIEDVELDTDVLKYIPEAERNKSDIPVSEWGKSESNNLEEESFTWRSYKGLTSSEKKYLAELTANLVSNIISTLQKDKDAKVRYFKDKYQDEVDFTTMSREEIIELVGVKELYYIVKEKLFSPTAVFARLSNGNNIVEDINTFKALNVAYKNFDALIRQSYAKLIILENHSVIKKQKNDIIFTEELDEDTQNELSDAKLEEKEREAYQMGQKQISARSSLSIEIRRAFEQLELPEVDPKFKLPTFVNSNEAVNKILLLCHECETIEQMEEILQKEADSTPWIYAILNKIKEEPFRSKFFNNFRKDFTQYSINYMDFDDTGKPVIKTRIINTVSAGEVFLKGILAGFNEGINQNLIKTRKDEIKGRGYVVESTINGISDKLEAVAEDLNKAYISQQANNLSSSRKSGKFKKALLESSKDIADILVKLGVAVKSDMVYKVLATDIKGRLDYSNTKTYKLLNNIRHIVKACKKHTNKDSLWNPVLKESEDNLYSQYSTIARMFSRYIESAIEPSTYQNGKMYYSFVVPSFMGKTIRNLKAKMGEETFKSYLENEFQPDSFFYQTDEERGTSYYLNDILQRLSVDENARRVLDFKVELAHLGTEYRDLSELGYTVSLMTEFFYADDTAWYRIPTLSNKPSAEYVKWFRYKDRAHRSYQDILCGKFQNLALQEIIRIQDVLANINSDPLSKIDNYDISTRDLKNLKEIKEKLSNGKNITAEDFSTLMDTKNSNGASFKFLTFLNYEVVNKTSLGKLLLAKINGETIDESAYSKEFFIQLKNWMDLKEKQEISKWEELGLFETQKTRSGDIVFKYVPFLYKNSVGSVAKRIRHRNPDLTEKEVANQAITEVRREIEDNLRNYIWNDTYVTSQIIQISSGDLAFYKNMGDFQKRNAQVHSPGNRLNVSATMQNGKPYSADGKLRTVNIVADKFASEIQSSVEFIFNNYIESLPNKGDKIAFGSIRDRILTDFNKIDDTDGQAYSCPTSYRKKLGMLGYWTGEMEEAYQRIISGKMNIDDFNILLQPLKPFVFTNVMKNRMGVNRPITRVPMQFKNSEYLILLSDAIIRGGQNRNIVMDNQLTAIFDVMEDSCYNGSEHNLDTYNGVGIDTVQFVSCVKTGATGAVYIGNQTPKEIRKTLKEAIYRKSDDERNNDVYGYNLDVVQTGSFFDYAIQQEVPAHLIDHEQLRGSQGRILSITDFTESELETEIIVNGKAIKVREAIDMYQNLLADNIYDSEKKLVKDLALDKKPSEKRRALSDILQEAIYKDARYGADLAYACEINPVTGKFNIPPGDPIQSIRIQQLMCSIIKSRINKQKVSGGPVVQTTSSGLSQDLNVRFTNKDGGLLDTYSEFCDKHNIVKDKDSAAQYKEYVKANQGKFSHMEAYISIPSTELKEDLLIKKGDSRFDPSRVGSYMTVEEGIKYGILNDEMLKAIAYRIPTEDKYSIIPIKIVGFVPSAEEVIMLPKEITLLTGSDFDIDKMYVMLKTFIRNNEGKYELPTDKKDIVDIRNNDVFDIQYELLRHPAVAARMFNPGNFNSLKKTARMITALENGLVASNITYAELSNMSLEELEDLVDSSETQNILFSTSQVYFHKQNMTAGKLIGMIANANSSHGFISLQNVTLRMKDEDKINIGGDVIKNLNKLDNVIARDGYTYISKNIASCLAASVDAVKDPVLNFMNLNTFTCNVAMTLLRLGFDIDTMGLFLSQPIIKYAAREWEKANNERYVSASSICSTILRDNVEEDRLKALKKHLNEEDFNKENLVSYMTDSLFDDSQVRALLVFQKLLGIATNVTTLTFLTKFNSVSNAVGPTIADTLLLEEKYLKFKQLQDSMRAPFNIGGTGDIIENSPILKAFYFTTVKSSENEFDRRKTGLAEKIFKDYFVHYSSTFKELLDIIRPRIKGNLDSKSINNLVNFLMVYKASLTKLLLGEHDSNYSARYYYTHNFPENFKKISKELSNNPLIQIIDYELPNKKVHVPTLNAKTGNYNVDVQETIKAAWSELTTEGVEDNLGYDLFIYNIFRNGFAFSPKTIGHLSSVDVKQSIPGYVELFEDPNYLNDSISTWNLFYQFLRNNSGNRRFVPEFKNDSIVELSKDINGTNILRFKPGTTLDMIDDIITTGDEDSYYIYPAIVFNGDLYMRDVETVDDDIINDVSDIEYRKVTPLGIPNDFIECDGNEKAIEMASVFHSDSSSPSIPYNYSENNPSKDNSEVAYEVTDDQRDDLHAIIRDFISEDLSKKYIEALNPSAPNRFTNSQLELLKNMADELREKGKNRKASKIDTIRHDISQQNVEVKESSEDAIRRATFYKSFENEVSEDKDKLNICD